MAQWVTSTNDSWEWRDAWQWSERIGPIRWYLSQDTSREEPYRYQIEDRAALSEYPNLDINEGSWQAESFWAGDWEYSSHLWVEGLATTTPPLLEEPELSADDESEDDERVEGTRRPDPRIETTTRPHFAPNGGFVWAVKMSIDQALDVDSWIVQRVELPDDLFWEAFLVPAGALTAEDEDIWQGRLDRPAGEMTVSAFAQHHVFDHGGDPPGMEGGGHDSSDSQQISSSRRPPFWLDDNGAPHSMTLAWTGSSTLQRFDTVPATEAATVVKGHSDLPHG